MRSTVSLVCRLVTVTLVVLVWQAPVRAVTIKPLMQIRVGDRGVCMTVFKGLKPEPFRL